MNRSQCNKNTFDSIESLIVALKDETAIFADVISHIDNNYQYTPTAFNNGNQYNSSEENQGSAKVFGFAQLTKLSKDDTLLLFAEHYQSVLNTPQGEDHSNIRNFMQFGWDGVTFDGTAITHS